MNAIRLIRLNFPAPMFLLVKVRALWEKAFMDTQMKPGLRILWIFTIFRMPEYHTQFMLFVSYPLSWIITFLVHLICYFFMRRRFPKQDVQPGEAAASA